VVGQPRWEVEVLGRGRRRGRNRDDADNVVIDLTDHLAGGARSDVASTPEERAAVDDFIERRRAEQRRREAEEELARLRARHWTGERVIEEANRGMDFWEHDDADPYAVLGLFPGATLEEAAAARKRIAIECHPDRSAAGVLPPDAARRMSAANAAYERLRQALRPIG
jgi:hypothetical protein